MHRRNPLSSSKLLTLYVFVLGYLIRRCMPLANDTSTPKSSLVLSQNVSSSKPNTAFNASCPVLCSGDLFENVHKFGVFKEGKYFVDMSLMDSPTDVMVAYRAHFPNGTDITENMVRNFVETFFYPPGRDVVTVKPPDFVKIPKIINSVYDRNIRQWISELNLIWKELFRETAPAVFKNPDRYSIIPLPHPFVVPGGRFREIYYWDSYWALEGVLLCGMKKSARSIIDNMLYMVKNIGYIPNGARKYYIGRSQPPMLIPMVELYLKHTKDLSILGEESISLMEEEFNFWVNNRSVEITHNSMNFTVFRYKTDINRPREESYFTDTNLYQDVQPDNKEHFYSDIRTAAESGWDFSTRWFVTADGKRSKSILDIRTHSIVPVDLNCLMARNAFSLSQFFTTLGNTSIAESYLNMANEMNKTISRLFWDDEKGFWFDYHLETETLLTEDFYGSGFFPLWTQMYGHERNRVYILDKVVNYMKREKLLDFPGGLPTSLINSTQQWDLPNGWAPLQHVAIIGLYEAEAYHSEAKNIAEQLTKKWILNNYGAFYNHTPHYMFEKYNVLTVSDTSSGGFYDTQTGFGWTNGVVFKLLSLFPHSGYTHERSHLFAIVVGVTLVLIMIVTSICYFCKTKRLGDRKPFLLRRLDSESEMERFQLTDAYDTTNDI